MYILVSTILSLTYVIQFNDLILRGN